jgi:cell division septal protein FtsQ
VPTKSKKTRTAADSKKSGTRHSATKALRLFLWLLLLLVAVALGVLACIGLYRLFFSANPQFTLEYIKIETTPAIDAQTVRSSLADMGIREGKTNLLAIDIGAVHRHLEAENIIKRARVIRRFPDTLIVSLYERRPIAVLYCRPRRLVDAEGIILPWWQTGDAALLPRITGIRNPRKLKTGAEITNEALAGALQFLQKIKSRPEGVLYDVTVIQLDHYLPSLRIHLRRRNTFCDDAIIVVPVKAMDAALDRLRDIVRLRVENHQSTSFIDVTYKRNIPVRP